MIRVMLAVNNDHGTFEGQLRAMSIADEFSLVGDPIPCHFEVAFRTWHRETRPHVTGQCVEHRDRFVLLRNALFVVGDQGRKWAIPALGRARNVGNICWDAIWVDDRHVGDLVGFVAYLHGQHWTCEEATVPLMRLWDARNWRELQRRLEDICGRDDHITTI